MEWLKKVVRHGRRHGDGNSAVCLPRVEPEKQSCLCSTGELGPRRASTLLVLAPPAFLSVCLSVCQPGLQRHGGCSAPCAAAQPGQGPVFSAHADKINVSPHVLWFKFLHLLFAPQIWGSTRFPVIALCSCHCCLFCCCCDSATMTLR